MPNAPHSFRLLHTVAAYVAGLVLLWTVQSSSAQSPAASALSPGAAREQNPGGVDYQPGPSATPDLAAEFGQLQAEGGGSPPAEAEEADLPIDAVALLASGGWLMIPLLAVSLLVVAVTIERVIALRSSRIAPRHLVKQITPMIRTTRRLPVQQVYALCQEYPSVAGRAIATACAAAGRPLPDISRTVEEQLQREIDVATAPVRWLSFFGSVAPLLGLTGTVWGLIRAFYDTTKMDVTNNRAEALSTGIYEALVTTLAGLLIAIPAAAAAQYFENRVLRKFRRVEELLAAIMPRLEDFEHRQRFEVIGRELLIRESEAAEAARRLRMVDADRTDRVDGEHAARGGRPPATAAVERGS